MRTEINTTTGISEISVRGIAFPNFFLCETTDIKPKLGFNDGHVAIETDYLLMATGDDVRTIYALNLDIDRTNLDDLLYPERKHFEFDYEDFDDVGDLYRLAIIDFDEESFMAAFYKFKHIINYFPDTEYAVYSIPLLPEIYAGAGLDIDDLITFLEAIDHPNLYKIAQETLALLYMSLGGYLAAIDIWDELINDLDIDDFEKLIYTMHQMYAHHQATLLGLRSFVSIAVYQPSNFSELNEMQVLIQEKML
ncbi:MAG: hypothetical protein FWG98_14580, partial [Candidatus Cloacimonetes bacterium]|nr:hypothetical protein [Candidatus Cloacimonadota bacterium]